MVLNTQALMFILEFAIVIAMGYMYVKRGPLPPDADQAVPLQSTDWHTLV